MGDIAKGVYEENEEVVIDPDATLMKNRDILMDDIKTKLEALGDVRSKAGKIYIKSKKPETRRKKFVQKIATLDLKGASGIKRVLVAEESGEWVIRTDGSNLSQLTFGPGNKSQPRWYSDGQRIAFVSDEDGNQEIYLMNPDGSHRINLTNNPNDDYDPAWSPDGTTLAFTTTRYIGQTQVYLLPISCTSIEDDCVPGEARSLSRGYADEFFPAWAPPDMQMPYWMPQDQPLAVSISINQAPKRLFFRSEDTGNPPIWYDVQDRILGVHDLRWSPDGQRIIFTWFYDGKNEIYALPIADRGNNWFKLTNSLGNHEPSISPDGQWIIFTSTRDQNPEVYLMKIDGSDQINLTNKLGRDMDPDWQPPPPD